MDLLDMNRINLLEELEELEDVDLSDSLNKPMDIDELLKILQTRYLMKHSPIDISLKFEKLTDTTIGVNTIAKMPDRDNGNMIATSLVSPHIIKTNQTMQSIDWLVGETIKRTFDHEFYEAFHVDNIRIYDPHTNE